MTEESEGRIARVKRHLKENAKVYLVGVGCLGVGYILHQPKIAVAPAMDSVDVLFAMGDSPQLTQEILVGLAEGTFDEWDCDLGTALDTFGPYEFAIAARSGAIFIHSLKTGE